MGAYKRGKIYWIRYAGPDRKIVYESTEQRDLRVAERIERQRKREVQDGTWQPKRKGDGRLTLATYGERWIQRMHDRKLSTARDYEQRWRDHVRPALGHMPLESIRPRDVRAFVEGLVASGQHAPRTVHHVYDVLRSILRDAVVDEVIAATPCVLPPGTLPKKRDKDPSWRHTAVYTRGEVETLISDSRIPWDRRVLYALLFLTGMRHGEAVGRRWRDYDRQASPLGRLHVWSQYDDRPLKTKRPREVPVHRTLAAILAEWRTQGWGMYQGRSPQNGDLIAPSRLGRVRSVRHTHRRLQEDLERVGLRSRRTHDARRTLISIARADGASRDVLRDITHGPRGDIMDDYTTLPWQTLCETIDCVRIQRRGRSQVDNLVDSQRAGGAKVPESEDVLSGADGTRSRGQRSGRGA